MAYEGLAWKLSETWKQDSSMANEYSSFITGGKVAYLTGPLRKGKREIEVERASNGRILYYPRRLEVCEVKALNMFI